jgi:hypothetical protein
MSTIDVQALPAGTWQVDKVHSSIGFAVDYMAGTFHGTFGDFGAAVTDGVLNGTQRSRPFRSRTTTSPRTCKARTSSTPRPTPN